MKPTSSYLENGGTIEVPEPYDSLDHEVELAVIISKKTRDVPKANAMDYVGGYALALDMTARELQSVAKVLYLLIVFCFTLIRSSLSFRLSIILLTYHDNLASIQHL